MVIFITILVFIFVLGILVFVHEFGHFLAARRLGIRVEEFAFGFPPTLWRKKVGNTTYKINAVPIGGYVKLYGEEGQHKKELNSFVAKPVWVRMIVVAAGVLMNFVLTFVLFWIGFSIGMPVTLTNPTDIPNAKITNQVIISDTQKGSPAALAGLSMGDIVLNINGESFNNAQEMANYTKSHLGQPITIQLKRYGMTKTITTTLGDTDAPLGVSIVEGQIVKVPFWQAPVTAIQETGKLFVAIFVGLGQIIKTLVVSKKVQEGVVGPVGILFLFKAAVKLGLLYIIQLTALISINLAIVNFLPFPALDGGKFIFLLIEAISRRKVSQKVENIIHTIGFAILILLILLITWRDVAQYFLRKG